jgi:hypothetical protein
VERLRAAGVAARGIEPRGPLAWEAWQRDLPVRVGDIAAELAVNDTGPLGAVVLSGIVDRSPVEDLVELLASAVSRLGPGGAVVVIGSDPSTPVRQLLLARAGLAQGGMLVPDPGDAPADGQFAVWGRADR